jgi:hypothetical protein
MILFEQILGFPFLVSAHFLPLCQNFFFSGNPFVRTKSPALVHETTGAANGVLSLFFFCVFATRGV